MKRYMQQFAAASKLLGKIEQKTVRGGSGSFAIYSCQVSPDGYTAGLICVGIYDNASARCQRCFGVSYAELQSYVNECPFKCAIP
jgi:hypothetical protein